MGQLQQPTVRTPQQFQSAAGHRRASGLGENAGKRLLTKIEDGNQITAAADATSVYAMTHGYLAIVEIKETDTLARRLCQEFHRFLRNGVIQRCNSILQVTQKRETLVA